MKKKTDRKMVKRTKTVKSARTKTKKKAPRVQKRAVRAQNKHIKKQVRTQKKKVARTQKKTVKIQRKPVKLQKKQVRAQKKVQLDETPLREMDSEEKEEFLYDEVTGGRNKKPVMSILNKTKLSKHEMDELFCDWS